MLLHSLLLDLLSFSLPSPLAPLAQNWTEHTQHEGCCKWPAHQLPHQLGLSSKLRPSVTSSLDPIWPLQTRLKWGNGLHQCSLSDCAQSISTHKGSSNLSWKLRYAAVTTGAVRCPEIQITVQNKGVWGPLNAVMCIYIRKSVNTACKFLWEPHGFLSRY